VQQETKGYNYSRSNNHIDKEPGVVSAESGLSPDTGGELENQCCVCFHKYEDLAEQTGFSVCVRYGFMKIAIKKC